MRTVPVLISLLIFASASAQDRCATTLYSSQQQATSPAYAEAIARTERFVQFQPSATGRDGAILPIVKIPVVVHVLYNTDAQNISTEQINSQITVLNQDFRKKNRDTSLTPLRFKGLAADVQIEFYLATSDPSGRATSGIVRKKTSVANWIANDKIKQSATGGDNPWDAKSYLNIWVGNLMGGLGYSSLPGGDAAKDGVVINPAGFGTVGTGAPYNLGRTTVHEIGHWLGLKHIWGDAACGSDGIDDTPVQGWYTTGCPGGFRSSCSNGELGDMYMNFMDYTYDACMSLFTEGQKSRMLAAFAEGGPRASILQSKGLSPAWNTEPAVEVSALLSIFPNPASADITLQLSAEDMGSVVSIYSSNGMLVKQVVVASAKQKIGIASLPQGVYTVACGKRRARFVKL